MAFWIRFGFFPALFVGCCVEFYMFNNFPKYSMRLLGDPTPTRTEIAAYEYHLQKQKTLQEMNEISQVVQNVGFDTTTLGQNK